MLSSAKTEQVQQLLDCGLVSQREIARRLRISRNSVAAVARQVLERTLIDSPEIPEPTQPAVRCQACGGMVYPPCRVCRLRRRLARKRRASRRCGPSAHSPSRARPNCT